MKSFGGQAESEQRPHKVSYHVSVKGKEAEEQIERLRSQLSQAGLSAKAVSNARLALPTL